MSRYEELEKIQQLKEKGIISEEEFLKEKEKILNDTKISNNAKNNSTTQFISEKKIKVLKIVTIIMAVITVVFFVVLNIFNYYKRNIINTDGGLWSLYFEAAKNLSFYKKASRSSYNELKAKLTICNNTVNKGHYLLMAFWLFIILTSILYLIENIFKLIKNKENKRTIIKKMIVKLIIVIIVIGIFVIMIECNKLNYYYSYNMFGEFL